MAATKALHEMSTDELAALSPEEFKRLADAYNDHSEVRENARNREIESEKEEQRQAMKELLAEAEKMDPEEFRSLPRINTMAEGDLGKPPIMHGIPDPEDPANPYEFREVPGWNHPLQPLMDKAWGTTPEQAIDTAQAKWDRSENNPANYPDATLADKCEGWVGVPLSSHAKAFIDKVERQEKLNHPDREIDEIMQGLVEPRPQPKFDPKYAREEVTPTRRTVLDVAKDVGRAVVDALKSKDTRPEWQGNRYDHDSAEADLIKNNVDPIWLDKDYHPDTHTAQQARDAEAAKRDIQDIVAGRSQSAAPQASTQAQGRKMERGQWIDPSKNKDRS